SSHRMERSQRGPIGCPVRGARGAAGLLFRARLSSRSGFRRRRRGDVDLLARCPSHGHRRARQHLRRSVPSREEPAGGAEAARELLPRGGRVMLKKRLIPSLVLREGAVVRSVGFTPTNIIPWNPMTAVDFFNKWAVDEIVLLDVSRDLSKRERFYEVVEGLSRKCFVPLTVGGWVTTTAEVRTLLRLGADKVTINTHAMRQPEFVTECARVFGSQCVVVAIDVRRKPDGTPEVWVDRGREATGWTASEWAREAERRGAGEIFLTSIDREGRGEGYDLELVRD